MYYSKSCLSGVMVAVDSRTLVNVQDVQSANNPVHSGDRPIMATGHEGLIVFNKDKFYIMYFIIYIYILYCYEDNHIVLCPAVFKCRLHWLKSTGSFGNL